MNETCRAFSGVGRRGMFSSLRFLPDALRQAIQGHEHGGEYSTIDARGLEGVWGCVNVSV